MKKREDYPDYESRPYLIYIFIGYILRIVGLSLIFSWMVSGPDKIIDLNTFLILSGIGLGWLICGFKW